MCDTIPDLLANLTGLHSSSFQQFPTKQTPFSKTAISHRFSRQHRMVQFSMLSIPYISVKFPALRPPCKAWLFRIRFPEQRVCLISSAVLSSIPIKELTKQNHFNLKFMRPISRRFCQIFKLMLTSYTLMIISSHTSS